MILIGEKINATRKGVGAAIAARDAGHIVQLAQAQAQAGAHYLDLNGGDPNPGKEVANMQWLVHVVQGACDLPLCIDSANRDAVEAGLALVKARPIVNSVSLEKDRLEGFLPILKRHRCLAVALCMSDEGMPAGVDDRLERAAGLIGRLTGIGLAVEDIIVDPCFLPVSAQPESGKAVCQAIAAIRAKFPTVHIGGGLSNVSYGLPGRRYVNLAMAAAAVLHGMDAAVLDPTAPYLVPLLLAAEVVSGADEWSANYVAAHRAGRLG